MSLSPSLPLDWEKQEQTWFYHEYYLHHLQVLFDSGSLMAHGVSSREGPGVSYRNYLKKCGPEVRKALYAASLALPGELWKSWNYGYLVSKKKDRYDYDTWGEVSQALEEKNRTSDSEPTQELLDHFIQGIDAVPEPARETAWKVSETYAKAMQSEMKPPRQILCFTQERSRR